MFGYWFFSTHYYHQGQQDDSLEGEYKGIGFKEGDVATSYRREQVPNTITLHDITNNSPVKEQLSQLSFDLDTITSSPDVENYDPSNLTMIETPSPVRMPFPGQ